MNCLISEFSQLVFSCTPGPDSGIEVVFSQLSILHGLEGATNFVPIEGPQRVYYQKIALGALTLRTTAILNALFKPKSGNMCLPPLWRSLTMHQWRSGSDMKKVEDRYSAG
ncbi:unnamed protein product [Calypogeia fissa]